jgi:rRNA maturation endonuclease Nob1
MPKLPPHIKIQRAKAFIKDGIERFLKRCEKCGNETYLAENQTLCEACGKKLNRTSCKRH